MEKKEIIERLMRLNLIESIVLGSFRMIQSESINQLSNIFSKQIFEYLRINKRIRSIEISNSIYNLFERIS